MDEGSATGTHRGGSHGRLPASGGGGVVLGRFGGGSGESSSGEAICQSLRVACQDGQAGCPGVSGVRAKSAAQTLCGQKRSRKTAQCPAGTTETAGRDAESRAKPSADGLPQLARLGGADHCHLERRKETPGRTDRAVSERAESLARTA